MKLLHKTPKCAWKLYFEARKVLLVCVFLIQGNFWPGKRTVYKDLQSSTSSDKEQEGIGERVNLGQE